MLRKFIKLLSLILLLPVLPILGAIKVKSAADAAKKWGDVTPGRSGYYESGTVGAGSEWESKTLGAAGAYKQAVSAGNIGAMFAGGVKKAGAAKFDRKVKDVGVARFGAGVAAAVTDYQAGVDPMLSTIAGLTLPARAPRGDIANRRRSEVVQEALNKKRLALRAAGA